MNVPEQLPQDALDTELDAALRAYPLRPTPPGLARAVLARVRALPARPKFRLSWLDLALPLFGGAMVGVLLAVVAVLATPQAVARAQGTLGIVLGSGGPQNATVVIIALAAAGVIGLAVLVAAGVALTVGSRR